MRKNILIVCITILTDLIFGYSISFAAVINYIGGFNPIPAYIYCNTNFTDETKIAIHDACVQWNGAGRGNLIYSITPYRCQAAESLRSTRRAFKVHSLKKFAKKTNIFRGMLYNNTTSYPLKNDKNEITKGNRGSGYLMECKQVQEGYTFPWNEWATFEADIDINTYYKWTNLTPTPSDSVDIGDVITHELGHLLGLGHETNTNPRATMQEPGAYGQIERRTIEQDDKNGIQYIY
jgi:hypothetical protein